MFLDGRPEFHIVDDATHFTLARYVRRQSSASIWRAIHQIWILTYMGPTEEIAGDQGSPYVSNDMKNNMAESNKELNGTPLENCKKYNRSFRMV